MQIVTQLEPAGAQAMARWLQDALGDEVEVSTVFLYQKAPSDFFPEPDLVVRDRPSSIRSRLAFLRKLKHLRDRRPDVVVAHTHYAMALAALLWRNSADVAVLAVHHSPLQKFSRPVQWAVRAARRRGLFVEEIYVSPAAVDQDQATVIPNPVPKPGPYVELEELSIDILIVGRHAAEKSIDTAITAISRLPDRHLTLVGGGPLTGDLAQQAEEADVSDRVTFAGSLSNAEVRSMMRRSKVFLLPSLWEAMPVALLEAVAEDCVIVASQIDAHQFLFSAGAAVGFSPRDADSLKIAIGMADDPVTRVNLTAGRGRVRALYAEESIGRQWLECIHSAGKSVGRADPGRARGV